MTPIRIGNLCYIASAKKLKGSGLEVGQEVYVASLKALPVKKSDPYLQRVYAVVMKIEDGKLLMPNEFEGEKDNGYRSYIVDPRNLEPLGDDKVKEITSSIEEQYSVETAN